LPTNIRIHPAYAERFRCIGSSCEDTCCRGWTVPVDRKTCDKYQALPQGPLRVLVNSSVVRTPENESATPGAVNSLPFATIRMNDAGECPLLTKENLCRVQAEVGPDFLPHTCATYPRVLSPLGAGGEEALTLSCPEAVRLVLFTPDLPLRVEIPEVEETSSDETPGTGSLMGNFWPIRAAALRLVRNRSYPLWQRIFLLELLCRRIDSIARGELKQSYSGFLSGFETVVEAGSLRGPMASLPADRKAQLDVVLRLAGLMLRKSIVTPRFAACAQAFTSGIGNGPGATLDSLAAHYALAHDRYYAPFFDRRPHIMENLLINMLFRYQFPFGRDVMRNGGQPQLARQSALLVAQFALMRGLLIGVAGHYGAAFSEAHVAHTVQAASKHFEHHTEFLNLAHELLVESRMDGARGLAILLRNAGVERGANESIPASNDVWHGNGQEQRNYQPIPLES